MRYIPPKKVRGGYFIAIAAAAPLMLIGSLLPNMAMLFVGVGIVLLDLIFYLLWYRCPHCGRHLGNSWGEFCPYCGKKVNV